MRQITTSELERLLDRGPLALFDVRGDVEYERGHIPGAKTAPMGSLVFRVARVMNPDSLVIVYGDGGERDESAEAARRLENLGMTNVARYSGGTAAWLAAGLELVESPHAKLQARGPVLDVRPLVIDREIAYSGAFRETPRDVAGAGG